MLGAQLNSEYTDAFEKLSWFSALVLRVHRGDDDAHTLYTYMHNFSAVE